MIEGDSSPDFVTPNATRSSERPAHLRRSASIQLRQYAQGMLDNEKQESPPLSQTAKTLQDAGAALDSGLRAAEPVLQELRIETHQLQDQVEQLRAQLADVPQLEREVLYHADRADEMERVARELQGRNNRLQVLAHARARSRQQLDAIRPLRILVWARAIDSAARALAQWREAVRYATAQDGARSGGADSGRQSGVGGLFPAATPGESAMVAQLRYQNMLLQRQIAQQALMTRRAVAAALLLAVMRKREDWQLASAWSMWRAADVRQLGDVARYSDWFRCTPRERPAACAAANNAAGAASSSRTTGGPRSVAELSLWPTVSSQRGEYRENLRRL